MSCLLQVSDPHFGTERPAVVDALRRFAGQLRPTALLLSGDITQRARVSQFRAARTFVDSLGIGPVLAVPGNHDIALFNLAARMLAPYARYRAVFGHELEPEFASADWLVLCVNTTRPWRHENGEVSAEQIERVARRLGAAAPRQVRIVVTHQPVAVTEAVDEKNRLRGAEAAVQRWSAAGADLIVGGHIHLPFVLELHRRWPGLQRRVWAVQAGTALSDRLRHESDNSVNVIRADAGSGGARRVAVERWDFSPATAAFEPVSIERIECDVR